MLTVKSDKKNMQVIWVLLGCVIVLFVTLIFSKRGTIGGAFIICFLPLTLTLRYWVSTGRTIVMDCTGCEIRFCGYKKKYQWKDLELKRFENYQNSVGYRTPYENGAIFSPKKVHKPTWLQPVQYCFLVHPLSFFFVQFLPDIPTKAQTEYPMIYVVDENEFRRKINDWGVVLDDS